MVGEGLEPLAMLEERIEKIMVATLRPGDVIVLKTNGEAPENLEYMQSVFKVAFPAHRTIILDGPIDMEIVRPEGGTCEHGHIRTFSSDRCVVCGEPRDEVGE